MNDWERIGWAAAIALGGYLAGVAPSQADQSLLQMIDGVRHRPVLPPHLRSQSRSFQSLDSVASLNQVTNVSELQDIAPSDWAYESLRSLVEQYGCIAGYPERAFKGDRALSRWEFAAGLNACMNAVERLLQENIAVLREDIDKIKRLAREFRIELDGMGVRVENLESRVSFIEGHQFSTTTKLNGETYIAWSGVWGSEAANEKPGTPITDGQIGVNYQTRLNFDTSFSGQDLLRVRLRAANFQFARAGSNLTDYNFSANTNSNVEIQKVQYRFPVSDNLTFWVSPVRMTLDDLSDPLAPYTNSLSDGALSFFGAIAPIYLMGDDSGPALGGLIEFTDTLNLSVMYSATNGSDPMPGQGFFNGTYQLATQLTYSPTATTGIGLAYMRQYLANGFVEGGSSLLGFEGVANSDAPFGNLATSSDNVALIWTWQLADWFSLEGWGMYTAAYGESGNRKGDRADLWNWKLSAAFPNLMAEGNVGVVTVGQPPYASYISNRNNVADIIPATTDTPWLIEVFYLYNVNNNISITPGITAAINPENNRNPLWIGTIRTSFKF